MIGNTVQISDIENQKIRGREIPGARWAESAAGYFVATGSRTIVLRRKGIVDQRVLTAC